MKKCGGLGGGGSGGGFKGPVVQEPVITPALSITLF